MRSEPETLPYPGLRAFSRAESHLFFGREGCVTDMLDRLTSGRFLAVLGASGSGKSSLVYTGLLDALELGLHPAGSDWLVAALRPGSTPVRNLAFKLLELRDGRDPDEADVEILAAGLRRGPRAVAEWYAAGNLRPGANLLLLIDQFEELFRYADYAGREEAEAFTRLLLESATAKDPAGADLPISVCITMRSEYLGACAMVPGLAERINDGLYLTPRMSRDECRAAIEGPASVCGFEIEPALTNQLLNDMAELAPWEADEETDQLQRLARRADQLPLMQHLLNLLWKIARERGRKDKIVLRRSDYIELGGLGGALDSHGEQVITDLCKASRDAGAPQGRMEQSIERVFRALVSGTSLATAVRRPCRFSEIVANVEEPTDGDLIVNNFRANDVNFLQPVASVPLTYETVVDISHESLIRQWQRLATWFDNEAVAAATWRRLLSEQEAYSSGNGDLLTGLTLSNRRHWWNRERPDAEWAARHGGNFEDVQRYFQASVEAEDKRAAEAATRAERDRWAWRRRFVAMSVLAGFAVLGLIASAYFLADSQQSKKRAVVFERRAVVAEYERRQEAQAKHNAMLRQRLELLARAESEAARAKRQAMLARDAEERAKSQELAAKQAKADAERSAEQVSRAYEHQKQLFQDLGNVVGNDAISGDATGNLMRDRIRGIVNAEKQISKQIRFRGRGTSAGAATDVERGACSTGEGIALPANQNFETASYIYAAVAQSLCRFAEQSSAMEKRDRILAWTWVGQAHERVGNAAEAVAAYEKAFELSSDWREHLSSRDRFSSTDLEQILPITKAAYQLAWYGRDLGHAEQWLAALKFADVVGEKYTPSDPDVIANPELAHALSTIANIWYNRGYGRYSPDFVLRARTLSEEYSALAASRSASPEIHRRYFFSVLNQAVYLESHEAIGREVEVACNIADALWKRPSNGSLNRNALLVLTACVEQRLVGAFQSNAQTAPSVLARLNEAVSRDPLDQDIRIARSELFTAMAKEKLRRQPPDGASAAAIEAISIADNRSLCSEEGATAFVTSQSSTWLLFEAARRDFLCALHTRSRLPNSQGELDNLITSLLSGEAFPCSGSSDCSEDQLNVSRAHRLAWINRIETALHRTLKSFPWSPWIAGTFVSIFEVKEEIRNDSERREDLMNLVQLVRPVAMNRPLDWELHLDLCRIQRQLIGMHVESDDLAAVRQVAADLRGTCEDIAAENDWAIWQHGVVLDAYRNIAKVPESLRDPVLRHALVYASEHGVESATELLLSDSSLDREMRGLLEKRRALQAEVVFSSDKERGGAFILRQQPSNAKTLAERLRAYQILTQNEDFTNSALNFLERSEKLARRTGVSFPRLADGIRTEATEQANFDKDRVYPIANMLVTFSSGRTPVNVDGIAFAGYDPCSISSSPVKGKPEFSTFLRDSIVLFASAESRNSFGEGAFPSFNGYDPVMLVSGQRVAGNPLITARDDGQLYLFANPENRAAWMRSKAHYRKSAEAAWLSIFPSYESDIRKEVEDEVINLKDCVY